MQMVIASRLNDGRVVFMGERGSWVDAIEEGTVLDSTEVAARSLSQAQEAVARNVIVDPYLIDVVIDDGGRRPAHVREVIRAFGPTVRTDAGASG